jgi:hypothetical protein
MYIRIKNLFSIIEIDVNPNTIANYELRNFMYEYFNN